MKKVKRFLMTLLPSFFALGMVVPALFNNQVKQEAGQDTAIYSQGLKHAQYNLPDLLVGESEDDDEEEEDIDVDKVVLHYYNEAGGCAGLFHRAALQRAVRELHHEYHRRNGCAAHLLGVGARGCTVDAG